MMTSNGALRPWEQNWRYGGRRGFSPYDRYALPDEEEEEEVYEEEPTWPREDEPEVIEGKYWFPDREGQPPRDEPPIPDEQEFDPEVLRKERESREFAERLSRAKGEAEMSRLERMREEARSKRVSRKKAEFELGKARRQEATRAAGQVAKAFAPAGAPGGVRAFYFGRPSKDLYGVSETPAKRALQPQLGALREAVRPKTSEARIREATQVRTRRDAPLHYGFLKDMIAPRGLSPVERAAYAEVESNSDIDTLRHIQDQLGRLGYSRGDVERAVRSLESRGLVVRAGSPAVYEVAVSSVPTGVPPIFKVSRGY